MSPLILTVLVVVPAIALVGLVLYFQSARRKKLIAASAEVGLVPIDPDELRVSEVPLFAHTGATVELAFMGSAGGFESYLFELEEGSGRSRHNVTVIGFLRHDVSLPYFQLHHRSLLERMSAAFAGDRVEIQGDEDFARKFILRGADAETIRNYFQPQVLSYLSGLPEDNWVLEGNGDSLVLYRPGRRVAAKNIFSFIQEMATIAQGFFSVVPKASAAY